MLLDTHVWLAFVDGDRRRIGLRARRALDRAAGRGELSLSAVSVFELMALELSGRIQLAMPVQTWIRESINRLGCRLHDVTSAVAIDAGLISSSALADPFDRLIAATANMLALPLVTRDERILDYARSSQRLRVVDARR